MMDPGLSGEDAKTPQSFFEQSHKLSLCNVGLPQVSFVKINAILQATLIQKLRYYLL